MNVFKHSFHSHLLDMTRLSFVRLPLVDNLHMPINNNDFLVTNTSAIEPDPAQLQWFDDVLAHVTDKQHACASGYLDTYKHGKKNSKIWF